MSLLCSKPSSTLSSHRAEAKASTKADWVLPALSPAASPSARPVHSTLLLPSWKRPCELLLPLGPLHVLPPLLAWHSPKRPKGSGPCWLQVCSNIFPGRPLLISLYKTPYPYPLCTHPAPFSCSALLQSCYQHVAYFISVYCLPTPECKLYDGMDSLDLLTVLLPGHGIGPDTLMG